jgi:uncharacterized protein YjbJ (UPF0337 family)
MFSLASPLLGSAVCAPRCSLEAAGSRGGALDTRTPMANRDTFKGQWMQLKGKIREQWGKLTDDEIDQMQGNAEMVIGKIQERYGRSREEAEREFDQWYERQGRAA